MRLGLRWASAAGVLLAAALATTLVPGAATAAPPTGSLTVARMTADGGENPLGVDAARPRLAWVLRPDRRDAVQTAYRVLVASSARGLADGEADVWDSGKVGSAESAGVAYGGPPLRAATRYHWKVRVWDRDDRPSSWSAPAWWETGLLEPADWSGARWIGAPAAEPAWPEGTVATASSFHPPNPGLTYEPANAIDGNAATFWNDSTLAAYPDRLTITAPSPVTLPGVTVSSHSDGVIQDYAVETWDGEQWVQQASITGSDAVTRQVGFPAPVSTTRVRITVTRAQQTRFPEFSRIAEVQPGLVDPLPVHPPAPLLRRDVAVAKRVEEARAYVSGLGYYVLTIDGERIGDRVLDPGFTVYDETALYSTYDVTSALRDPGDHTLGVALGRGFFGLYPEDTKYWGNAPWLGEPRLRLKLEIRYADGSRDTVVSDASWRAHDGPTTRDSIYLGETYDARRALPGWDTPGFDANGWRPAAEVAAPTANLRSQRVEPIRVVDTMRAERITNPRPGTYMFRFPVMTAGWARLTVSGTAGTEVTLRYGEQLRDNGTVNNDGDPGLTNGPIQSDRYILSGDGTETWEPSFSYKGFQYVQVDGYPGVPDEDDVVARVVHTDVRNAGTFSSSDDLLNTIHAMTRRTILNNLHSIFTDTPVFEKRGWLGDANVLLPATTDNFGMHRFYRKWLRDILDNQGADGAGVELAPNPFPAGYTDPIWAGALVEIPWRLYRDYGDRDVLAESYVAMARYVDYLVAHSDGLIQQGFYGDWVAPSTSGTFPFPPEGARLTATAYFHRYAVLVARAARALGHDADADRFSALAGKIEQAFNVEFLDRERAIYRTERAVGYRQTSNAVPLAFGLVPPDLVDEVTANLVADVRARGNHLNTGRAGTQHLLPVLTERGHVDTAFAIATQRTYPSWGYWIENGATSLWEAWETTTRSRDHAFLGSVDDWFYRYLAGIRPAAPRYARITVRPYVPAHLDRATAAQETVRGTVASSWRKTGGTFHLDVTVPANATATVHVPLFGGEVAGANRGAKRVRVEDDAAVYEVGSGRWSFTSRLPEEHLRSLSVSAEPQRIAAAPGEPMTVDVTVTGRAPGGVRGSLAVIVPDGWSATPAAPAFELDRHGALDSETIEVTITPPQTATGEEATIAFEAEGRGMSGSAETRAVLLGRWPAGTTAAASSHHPSNVVGGEVRTYEPANAIDGDLATFWNDATPGAYPDVLTITAPRPVTLSGVSFASFADGVPVDFDVQTWDGSAWVTRASVTGNDRVARRIPFGAAVTTSRVRLVVTRDQFQHGEFSRVAELSP
jgi:alpha-L-rhamnosidase